MLRQITILFIFFSFTFSTIDELVKLCFDKTECVQELLDLDDSEPDDSEKDVDLNKIFQDNIYFHFPKIFITPKLAFIQSHTRNYYKQVIYSIVSPPPEA